jgi:uncharacterized membrane protein YfcA
VLGGILGAYVVTELPEKPVRVFVTIYLFGMALLIAQRMMKDQVTRKRVRGTIPIGVAGGFLDAIGGGGWGSIVNSTLIARGETPRISIGSVSLAEFLVTAAISVTFVMALDLATYGRLLPTSRQDGRRRTSRRSRQSLSRLSTRLAEPLWAAGLQQRQRQRSKLLQEAQT